MLRRLRRHVLQPTHVPESLVALTERLLSRNQRVHGSGRSLRLHYGLGCPTPDDQLSAWIYGGYRSFSHVTRAALDFACEIRSAKIADNDKVTLMNHYWTLDAFADSPKSVRERVGCEFHSFPTPRSLTKQYQYALFNPEAYELFFLSVA